MVAIGIPSLRSSLVAKRHGSEFCVIARDLDLESITAIKYIAKIHLTRYKDR
jgi:hypothetical protein